MIDTKLTLTQDYFRALLENMVSMGQLAPTVGVTATPAQIVSATLPELQDIIRVSFPLEIINRSSDLVVHAEGPAVHGASPTLAAVNWLTANVLRALRGLSVGLFDLMQRDTRIVQRLLDLRLTGFAPGSLYAGFAVAQPPTDLIDNSSETMIPRIREAIRSLPRVSAFIGDEAISPEVEEVESDPAQRDNVYTTLLRMTPTGRLGVHTLGIGSPDVQMVSLSQRERVVLKDAVEHPRLYKRKQGTFAGELLEVDLGANRFHVRNIPNVGTLRCIAPPSFDRAKAKLALGEQVRVTGEYESDRNGKPRLMIVTNIVPLPPPAQSTLS